MLNRNVNYTLDGKTNCKSSSSRNDKQMTSAVSTSSKTAIKYGDPKCLFGRDIDILTSNLKIGNFNNNIRTIFPPIIINPYLTPKRNKISSTSSTNNNQRNNPYNNNLKINSRADVNQITPSIPKLPNPYLTPINFTESRNTNNINNRNNNISTGTGTINDNQPQYDINSKDQSRALLVKINPDQLRRRLATKIKLGTAGVGMSSTEIKENKISEINSRNYVSAKNSDDSQFFETIDEFGGDLKILCDIVPDGHTETRRFYVMVRGKKKNNKKEILNLCLILCAKK